MQTLHRKHHCAEPGCSKMVETSLQLEDTTPELIAAGNMYLRTWLKLADTRCLVCRRPEYTMELLELEQLILQGKPCSLEALHPAIHTTAIVCPRAGLRVVEDPVEQLQTLLQSITKRLVAVEQKLLQWHELEREIINAN